MPTKPVKKTTREKNGNCFIIMPITTPPDFLPSYRNDDSHFKHVLDCLFIPAIERAGLSAIPPVAKGAELIQSRTIKHIEEASLVLCDISTLNPNVFFELGIRTALNKPVCLVMDDITDKIPFDTGIINHYKYKYSLPVWEIEEEIEKLHQHIADSRKTSSADNELWKHFGISSIAQPPKERAGTPEILKYLASQIESLRKDIYAQKPTAGLDIHRDGVSHITGGGLITARGFQTPAAFDPEQAASHAIFEKLAESQAAIAEGLAKYSCAVGGKTSRESAEDHESSLSSENHLPDEKK